MLPASSGIGWPTWAPKARKQNSRMSARVKRSPATQVRPASRPSSQISRSRAISFSSLAPSAPTSLMRLANRARPSAARKPLAMGSQMLRSMRRTHMRVSARSSGVEPIRAGPEPISSRYSQIAVISEMVLPLSSSSDGSWPATLTVELNGGRRFSPPIRSTSCLAMSRPFSAMNMRTTCGLGPTEL